MAQPQNPPRTFSPMPPMSPSPAPLTLPTAAKQTQRVMAGSPMPTSNGGSNGGSVGGSVGYKSSNSPATPGTPSSIASPLLPMPLTTTQSMANSPALATTAASAVASPGLTLPQPQINGGGGASPSLHLPATSPSGGQTISPKPTPSPTPLTPTGPPTPSGHALPQLAPAPAPAGTGNIFVPLAANPATPMTQPQSQQQQQQQPQHIQQQPLQHAQHQQQHAQLYPQQQQQQPPLPPQQLQHPYQQPPPAPPLGTMGPPQKPPTKEYQYDVDDSLAGTGIDLRQEEQFQAEYFAGSFRAEARTGFPAGPPGSRASFYGSLVANQAATPTLDEANQQRAAAAAAKLAWDESAKGLASARGNALRNRFLQFNTLHARFDSVAREHGLGLVVEAKSGPQQAPSFSASASGFPSSGRMRPDVEFPKPQVTVKTVVGPDGALVTTTGTFLPEDTFLADQLALLSLAAKHRIRELLEDAAKVAVTRQLSSHGGVPEEWADAAAPLSELPASAVPGQNGTWPMETDGGSPRNAVANPLKRPLEADETAAAAPATTAKKTLGTNVLAQSLRAVGRTERDMEEKRLHKRLKREGKRPDGSPAGTAPGTPGMSGAGPGPGAGGVGAGGGGGSGGSGSGGGGGDGEKAPTKKELKKSAAAKAAEQNDTLSANRTSMTFLGGRKKQYSWLSGGSSTPKRSGGMGGSGGSGASSTAAGGGGGGGGAGGDGGGSGQAGAAHGGAGGHGSGGRPGDPMMLTGEGRSKLGVWREDGPRGVGVQLRDWVVVLEADGREVKALQDAYNKLDGNLLPPKLA